MKPPQIYQHLKELAEKFEVSVSEENFRKDGIHVRSGFCIAGGKKLFLINKHAKIADKIELLAAFLSTLPHEQYYVVPTVRDMLRTSGSKERPIEEDERDPDPQTD